MITPRRKRRSIRDDFARWGRAGGVARAKGMTTMERHDAALRAGLRRWEGITPEARSLAARKAIEARWRKARAAQP
jgi:hypothetical protein